MIIELFDLSTCLPYWLRARQLSTSGYFAVEKPCTHSALECEFNSVPNSGITFSGLWPLLSCSGNEQHVEEELKKQALMAFKRFEDVWDFFDFWKRGNTFDACLVFANAVQQRWPDDPEVKRMITKIKTMLEQNLTFFRSVKVEVMWADDFGWWGLMALNARKLLLDMAYRQWIWFADWFDLEEYEFLKKLSTDGALVQERPIAMFEGSAYTDKIHPPWAEGWVWTGDQGMLVAALTDMIEVKEDLAKFIARNSLDADFNTNTFETEAKAIIQKIGKGVQNGLIADADGLIREAPCLSSFGPVHGGDYLAGRGIMMRYLGSAREKALLGVNLDEAVVKTAKAIWETRNPENNQFQPEYTTAENDKRYIEQFRELWGLADDTQKWELHTMPEEHKIGACQAVGMDMIGAAIKTFK